MMVLDSDPNWRNLYWAQQAEYVEHEEVPTICKLLDLHGWFFDDVYAYRYHGKTIDGNGHKRYVVRFKHFWTEFVNYRIPMEKRKPWSNHKQLKLTKCLSSKESEKL